MKRFIDTIRNIWTIEELRNRILLTILMVSIYRLGSYVVLPGVNIDVLKASASSQSGGIVGLINMFSGGAFFKSINFWTWHNALYHGVHYYSAFGNGRTIFSKTATRR